MALVLEIRITLDFHQALSAVRSKFRPRRDPLKLPLQTKITFEISRFISVIKSFALQPKKQLRVIRSSYRHPLAKCPNFTFFAAFRSSSIFRQPGFNASTQLAQDQSCYKSAFEPRIDIYRNDIRRAAVQHPQQRDQPLEMGPVP